MQDNDVERRQGIGGMHDITDDAWPRFNCDETGRRGTHSSVQTRSAHLLRTLQPFNKLCLAELKFHTVL